MKRFKYSKFARFFKCLFEGHGIKWAIYSQILPIYIKIPNSRYKIAIWNCGGPERIWKDTRITIREKDGSIWRFTIKPGDHKEDTKRCSIHFNPFGLNIHKLFNKKCDTAQN